jgi:hypothetical protein
VKIYAFDFAAPTNYVVLVTIFFKKLSKNLQRSKLKHASAHRFFEQEGKAIKRREKGEKEGL